MADHTHIEWTDATWNPITGCSVVSAGCKHCYAMKLAGTRLAHHPSRAGLTIDTAAGPVWNGEVRLNEAWLGQPLRWRRPRRIFVCAHGDLFHEAIPDAWIDCVFAVMALAKQHTFQVLTKRAARLHAYTTNPDTPWRIAQFVTDAGAEVTISPFDDGLKGLRLPNVWLGISVENQAAADERIPLLLQSPAAVRWLSAEPLLGPINFRWAPYAHQAAGQTYREYLKHAGTVNEFEALRKLDWVVVGGESGAGARPMHPVWARSLRDQCAAAGVPFLFKQWGEWQIASVANGHHDFDMARNAAHWVFPDGLLQKPSSIREGWTGGDPWAMVRVGKKAAGRLLDGVLHDGYPEPRA